MADEPGAALAAQYLRRHAAIGPNVGFLVGNLSHDDDDLAADLAHVRTTPLPVRPPLDAHRVMEALLLLLLSRETARARLKSCVSLYTITPAEPVEELSFALSRLLEDTAARAALFEAPDTAVTVLTDAGASAQQARTALAAGQAVILVLSPGTAMTLGRLQTGEIKLARPDRALIATLAQIIAPRAPEADPEALSPDDALRHLTLFEIAIALLRVHHAPDKKHLAPLIEEDAPGDALAAVHGAPEVQAMLEQLHRDVADWQRGACCWDALVSSLLLHGPPGTGKTMRARAFAARAGLPFIATSYGEATASGPGTGHLGSTLKGIEAAVSRAIRAAPSVLLIDEFDAFGRRGMSGGNTSYMQGLVTGLLRFLDIIKATPGVVLIAATNDLEAIDPALRRAGRFGRVMHVPLPDQAARRAMLADALPELAPAQHDALQKRLIGRSGADIMELARDARERARRRGAPLAHDDLAQALTGRFGADDPSVLRRCAVHEAGHLLVGHLVGLAIPHRVTVSLHGGVVVRPHPPLMTRADVDAWLVMLLGGRAAERWCYGAVSAGAGDGPGSDLACARDLAVWALREAHLGAQSDLVWARTGGALDTATHARIASILQRAETRASALIAAHPRELNDLAAACETAGELEQAQLTDLLRETFPTTSNLEGDQK